MAPPNLGNLILHAYAKVSAATPPVVTDSVNIIGVTRTGAGVTVLELGTQIDDTQRFVSSTCADAVAGIVQKDPATQTDSTVGILAFDAAAAAADRAYEVAIYRVSVPT